MEEFKRAYNSLNTAQKQAVDKIDGPMLVIAGPGTGKTQLLSTRVANILQKTDTDASQILCLTFTESGSSNMRSRLTSMIGKDAYNVNINTYHGFGNELIRDYYQYFPDFQITRPAEQLILDKIVRQIQAKLPYGNPIKSDTFIRSIKKLISNAKREFISPEELLSKAQSNLAYLIQINLIALVTFSSFDRMSKKTVILFSNFLKEISRVETDNQDLAQIIIQELTFTLNDFDETGSTKTLTKWKEKWLEKDNQGRLTLKGIFQNQKIAALAEVYDNYEKKLREQGIYDYDDMIGLTLSALKTNDEFRFNIQEKYQYLMLDEFQDTNGAQFKLVELLTNNEIFEKRPNVMAVGDDDQAIFSFQGANYSHMANFVKLYEDVTIINLTENYRSTSEILSLADSVGTQIEERLKIDKNFTKRLNANRKSNNKSALKRVQFKSAISQYGFIADEIRKLIDGGVKAKQIAVIGRKHSNLMPIVPYLHKKDIKIRYDKRDNILEDSHINILISMSKLVIALKYNKNSELDELWPEVLSADFFEIPTSSIWELSWAAHDNKKPWREILFENPKTKLICLFFYRLALISDDETLETILDYLIGINELDLNEDDNLKMTSNFYQYYFSEESEINSPLTFWELLQNLSVLRNRLRDYSANMEDGLGLEDFIEYIEDNKQSNIRITNDSPLIESDDAVFVSTAHNVKGLEFEAVFVLDVLETVWGSKSKDDSDKITTPPTLEALQSIGTNEDERIRLFYVAITRAKNILYLCDYQRTNTNKSTLGLKYLSEHQDENEDLISPYLPEKYRLVISDHKTVPTIDQIVSSWQTRHIESSHDIKMQSLLSERLNTFKLSPTNLNKFTNVEREGPRAFFIDSLLRFPKAKSPIAEYGTAMHNTLEWLYKQADINNEIPNLDKIINIFNKNLDSKDISKAEKKLLRVRGEESLNSYIKSVDLSPSLMTLAEIPFVSESVFVGDAHLTGNIDKMIVDPKTRNVSIVDYKTGKSHTKWTSEVKMHNYERQLYFYKILLENSRSYNKYKVVDAYLEFVEPDLNGNINKLHIKFDPEKEEQTKKLIEAIYKKIITLDMPDISGYAKTLKGIKQFEQDLIDGK
jgi:DNA helicase-2/ATP-dependent DNA helicase PcrA